MKLTVQQLMDYLRCSMMYRFRYIDEVEVVTRFNPSKVSLDEQFDNEIHKIGYHIFNYIQDGKYPTEYLLRKKWEQLWCKDKSREDVVFENTVKRGMSSMKRLEKQGVKVISQSHPKFKENPGVPIIVGKRMDVKVGRHTLTTTLDLIREVVMEGKPIIELMDFQSGIKVTDRFTRTPMNLHIHQDLAVTAASLGFYQLTGMHEDRIVYYDMVNDKEHITKRTEQDYQALEHVLNHVERAMEHKIYYPVMNDRCTECPFLLECKRRDWYQGGEDHDKN